MGERTDDLDAELEELVDDEYGDVEDVGSPGDVGGLEDGDSVGDVGTGLDDFGLDAGSSTTNDVEPLGQDTRAGRSRTAGAEEPGRVRSWLGSLFSTRWFGAAAIASGVGVFGAGAIPLPFTGYVGVFLAGAVIGLVSSERRYLEVAAAGALAAAVATFLSAIALVLLAVGIPYVVVAAVLGAVAGTVGHYAGRDLRHGLTREI